MAHLKKSATTGHLLKNAAGHLVKTCGVPCSACVSTPKKITCTFSGISPLGAGECYKFSDYAYGRFVFLDSPDQTFTLMQSSTDPCLWRTENASMQVHTRWYGNQYRCLADLPNSEAVVNIDVVEYRAEADSVIGWVRWFSGPENLVLFSTELPEGYYNIDCPTSGVSYDNSNYYPMGGVLVGLDGAAIVS